MGFFFKGVSRDNSKNKVEQNMKAFIFKNNNFEKLGIPICV